MTFVCNYATRSCNSRGKSVILFRVLAVARDRGVGVAPGGCVAKKNVGLLFVFRFMVPWTYVLAGTFSETFLG
jgi:hypothetical protein